MTTLHGRLSDLAEESSRADAAEPDSGDLWSRGVRRHRRQQLGSGVVVGVVVALIAGIVGLSWSRSDVDVQPASEVGHLGLPDHFYFPPERLPSTEDTGPIGPLSALMSGLEEPVGISATGEYARLDLPRASGAGDDPAMPVLSADGGRVAYWSTGRSSDEPVDAWPLAGVSVYDTVTGETVTYDVETAHGLNPNGMAWAGDNLWFQVWQYDAPRGDGSRGSRLQSTVVWNPGDDSSRTWDPRPEGLDYVSGVTAWDGALVDLGGQGALRLFRPEGSQVRARISGRRSLVSEVHLDEAGARVAALRDVDGQNTTSDVPMPVLVGDLPDAGSSDPAPVSLREVPGTSDSGVQVLLGWRDDRHVVGYRYGEGVEPGYVSIDVDTGETEVLSVIVDANLPDLAQGALAGPVFDAPRPPEPLDPRLVYGGIVLVLLVGCAALGWWRRRVRP